MDTDEYEKARAVLQAASNFFETIGFEISEQSEFKQGSWFKEKIVYKIRSAFRSKEAQELFKKAKKAIELQQLEKLQSEVTKNYADAASTFLNSIKDVPNIATKLGSLVIAKATIDGVPQVAIKQLTMEQLIQLEENRDLMNNPLKLLSRLNEGATGNFSL